MKKGDLVYNPSLEQAGVILGFSIDFLIHRYDVPEYRVLWQKTGHVSENVLRNHIRKVVDEDR